MMMNLGCTLLNADVLPGFLLAVEEYWNGV